MRIIKSKRGNLMKNLLIGTFLMSLISLPASAGMLGLDWEATGEYNMDTEVSTLDMQVGKTIMWNSVSLSANADFDIVNTEFDGTDYKASVLVPNSSIEMYLETGLDNEWAREDIVAGVKFSW